MPGGIRSRIYFVLVVSLILAACNRPDLVEPTLTATLTFEEIVALVGAALIDEGKMTEAAQPSDTPVPAEPSPAPTLTNTSTPASTLTHAPTLTPSPTDKPTLAPPTNTSTPVPTLAPSPTNKPTLAPPANTLAPSPTSTPSPTAKPTSAPPTPCPKFTSATLSAVVVSRTNAVALTWRSTGGCGPFTGTLTATYKGDSSPYAAYEIKDQSGKLADNPEVRCEGTIVYVLTLKDSSGQTVTASNSDVYWLC